MTVPAPDTRARAEIVRSVVFAALMLAAAPGIRLAMWFGLIDAAAAHWIPRLTMSIVGAYLVVTGNALPKTLTPLASLTCDAAVVQRFQRIAGWANVLTGAALVVIWLALPLEIAKPATLIVVPIGMGIVVLQPVRIWLRRRAA